ncbi:OmpH family outer membrane protein [Parasphingopyxis marina]|uniref:OmpH family outer membrane protein n=1 Tax=Parasphingopyxis marina TaxID=2761622 RepID=A0A842HZA4_9SPHN|nr:OmpH family outer membrane protein [Parasphingopyxis marina]MBC2777847.1 OmpH family outer membrane protein [Parasphingopyxis marina]
MFSKTKTFFAGLLLALPMVATTPAHAQARGVGVISVDGAIQATTAYQAAVGQIQSTYATQIQQAQARAVALQTELQPLQTAAQAAQAANTNPQVTPPAVTTFVQRQQAAEQELATLNRPMVLARQYIREQIGIHFNDAMTAAMTASNVDLVLSPEAITSIAPNSPANITAAVTAQLNTRVASVQAIPPAGWNPGDTLRAAQAAEQSTAQPEGR